MAAVTAPLPMPLEGPASLPAAGPAAAAGPASRTTAARCRAPIRRNLAAQLYGQAVTIGIQLGLVPLLIAGWGLERYGLWLTLSALPLILAVADLGFTFVVKNDMSMRIASGDIEGARTSFQAVMALLLPLCLGLAALLGLGLLCLPLGRWFAQPREAQLVLAALLAATLLYQPFLLIAAGIRCTGHAAAEATLAATARLGEALAWAAVALSGGGLAAAALAGLAWRAGCLVLAALALDRQSRWLRPWLAPGGLRQPALRARLAALAPPAGQCLGLAAGNALLIHGPLLLLGLLAGPTAAALFGLGRTLARLGMAGANLVSNALTPEYAFAAGRGDPQRLRALFRLQGRLCRAGGAVYLGLALLFPAATGWLSHGTLAPDRPLLALLVLAVLLEIGWTLALTPLAALNRPGTLPAWTIAAGLACLVTAALLPDPRAIAAALVLAHGGLALRAGIAWRQLAPKER